MRTLQIQPKYASRDLWEALAVQEDLGYEVIELSMPPALTDMKLPDGAESNGSFVRTEDPGNSGSAESGRCVNWYRESGRAGSVHGAFINVNPASSDPVMRAVSRRRCHESCVLARQLGAGNVVFHSSCEPFLRGAYLESWAGQCAAFLEELRKAYADLRIWIENSQDTDPGPITELMGRCTDPGIGVCLDIGHVHYSRASLEQWFDTLGERIGYLHLSDNRGLFDDHLPVGEGSVDWAAADALWRGLGREVRMTLETGGMEGVRRSLAYLREHGYFGL